MPLSSSPPTPFPLYLLPSMPFRRRRSSTLSASTSSPTSTPSSSPPNQSPSFLSTSSTSHLRCHKCLTDLIPTASIISKGFTGRHGRAYLVAPPTNTSFNPLRIRISRSGSGGWEKGGLPNTFTHKPVPRQLVTGAHTVSDISCRNCGIVLGWKYVDAEEESQRYKVGKFILETKRVVGCVDWEEHDEGCGAYGEGGTREEEEIEFDSQDEDECEDLFSGIWSPSLARKRRKMRAFGREDSD